MALFELYMERGDVFGNKRIFQLYAHKERIAHAFGAASGEKLDTKRVSRIQYVRECGGYRSPESQWSELQAKINGCNNDDA
jgi:hypothetical protein